MPAPAHTSPEVPEDPAPDDPAALSAFVARRAGRVLSYLEHVVPPGGAVAAAGDAFAGYRTARAADPDAEAPATTLLRAVRRAAAEHAENPVRPDGRERSSTRTSACAVMPRLLVAWTESRLPDPDVERLVAHLHACPDCRAMRDAFDHAELGHRAGEAVEPDRDAVASIARAMAGSDAVRETAAARRETPADRQDGAEARDPDGPRSDAPHVDEHRDDAPSAGVVRRRLRRRAVPGRVAATGTGADGAPSTGDRSGGASDAAGRPVAEDGTAPPDPGRGTPATATPSRDRGAPTDDPDVGTPSDGGTTSPRRADDGRTISSSERSATPADRGGSAGAAGDGRSRTTLPARRRRTAIPAPPPTRADGAASDVARSSTSLPDAPSSPDRDDAAGDPVARRRRVSGRRTAIPERPARRRTELPARPAADPPRGDRSGGATSRRGDGDGPDDPLGPEALGYAVPRSGLPRAPRRPAVPRVRRRRTPRPPSEAVVAAAATTDEDRTAPADPTPTKAEAAEARAAEAAAERRDAAERRERERQDAERDAAVAGTDDDAPAPDDRSTATADDDHGADATPDDLDADGTADDLDRTPGPATVAPATIAQGMPTTAAGTGGLAAVGRRVLAVPIVRQLGVPAVLLLIVLIAALVAAGVFAGQQEDTVAPVTRPTIPSVPADPSDIPPLR